MMIILKTCYEIHQSCWLDNISYRRSLLWSQMWHLSACLHLKHLLQIEHWNGRSLVWTTWCLVRYFFRLNRLLQVVQCNLCSSVEIGSCSPSSSLCVTRLLCDEDRSLAWIRSCSVRLCFSLKHLPQVVHSKYSVWIRSCSARYRSSLKRLLQIVHWNGYWLVWIARSCTTCTLKWEIIVMDSRVLRKIR